MRRGIESVSNTAVSAAALLGSFLVDGEVSAMKGQIYVR